MNPLKAAGSLLDSGLRRNDVMWWRWGESTYIVLQLFILTIINVYPYTYPYTLFWIIHQFDSVFRSRFDSGDSWSPDYRANGPLGSLELMVGMATKHSGAVIRLRDFRDPSFGG